MSDLKPPLEGHSLWFIAAKEDHDPLQALINEVAKQLDTKRFDAHATLIGLLDFDQTRADEVKRGAESIAKQYKPFGLELTGFGTRDMHLQSAFLTAVPHQTFFDTNTDARKFFGHEEDPPLMPHMSLVYGDVDGAAKYQAQQRVNSVLKFPKIVQIDRVAAVNVYGHPNEWKIIAEYPLSG